MARTTSLAIGSPVDAVNAIGLAEAGAHVVLAARTKADLDAVATEIERVGGRALVVPTDVMDPAALEALVDGGTETPAISVPAPPLEPAPGSPASQQEDHLP